MSETASVIGKIDEVLLSQYEMSFDMKLLRNEVK